jgi:hypothetical protein
MNVKMSRLGFVCGAMLLVCFFCVAAQFAIKFNYDNVLASLAAGIGIFCLTSYLWFSRPFDDTPLSSLALFGFCVTSEFAALVAQTTQGLEFIYFLRDPVRTFAMLTGVQCVAIAVHYAYRKFEPLYGFRDWLAHTLMSPLGLHAVPKPAALWLLSVPGMLSMLQGGAGFGDVSGKALQAMEFLVWMPFLILAYQRQFGKAYSDSKSQWIWVSLYAVLIMGAAVARNARGLMFMGPVSVVLLYMLVAVREKGPMPARSVTRVAGALALVAIAVVVFADLATAMAVVRSKRDDVKNWELVKETYETVMDRSKIEAYRETVFLEGRASNFDEIYISNPILNRFSETKFHDNMIFFSRGMNEADRSRVIDENLNKVVTLLPQPALDFLELKIKKNDFSFSMGDIYVNAVTGADLGSFVTGSIWADAFVIFGMFWPFAVGMMLLVVYVQLDSLTRLDAGHFISPVGLCMAWTIFIYGIGGESFAVKAAMLLREIPQRLMFFVLLLAPLRLFAPSLFYRGDTGAQDRVGSL